MAEVKHRSVASTASLRAGGNRDGVWVIVAPESRRGRPAGASWSRTPLRRLLLLLRRDDRLGDRGIFLVVQPGEENLVDDDADRDGEGDAEDRPDGTVQRRAQGDRHRDDDRGET